MADYSKPIRKILREHGFVHKRWGHGDHEIFENKTSHKTVPVPAKLDNKITANGIMKQAEINHKF